jgi:hypothetical protein
VKNLMLIFVLIFSSCVGSKKSSSFAEFDYKLTSEWIYADTITGLKANGELITRPPGIEQLVMGLRIINKNGLFYKNHCVYYLVPYREREGKLKIEEMKNLTECPEESSNENVFLALDGLGNLKISFQDFKIILSFEYEKQPHLIEIPTPNIEDGVVHEKYMSMKEKRLFSGMKLLRLTDESMDHSLNRYLGKLSDRFSLATAIRCHEVNKNCETVGENRCGECRYGWYEVVDFQCPQGGSKFCGQNHCGEKNEPACPRGVKVVDPEDAGICQSDLEPKRNLEKILICQ